MATCQRGPRPLPRPRPRPRPSTVLRLLLRLGLLAFSVSMFAVKTIQSFRELRAQNIGTEVSQSVSERVVGRVASNYQTSSRKGILVRSILLFFLKTRLIPRNLDDKHIFLPWRERLGNPARQPTPLSTYVRYCR